MIDMHNHILIDIDDGLYYFYPGDNEQTIKDYKDNLNLK